jgi:Icc-related predicted phosphoesterase
VLRGCGIAVLHYSPIHATVVGEPPEIEAFLGSSRLEEPIDRYRVSTVFHGHAHRGSPEGKTKGNASVYSVAMPVLLAINPDKLPLRIVEVTVTDAVVA